MRDKPDNILFEYSRRFSDLAVMFSKPRKSKNGYSIKGTAVHARTGVRYDIADCRLTVPKNMINSARERIMYKLEEKYSRLIGASENTDVYANTEKFIKNLMAEIKNGYRLMPTWTSVETNSKALDYFMTNTLPELKSFITGERIFLSSDADDLREKIYQKVNSNGKKKNNNSVNRTVNWHMTEAACILSILYKNVDGFPLCEIPDKYISVSSPANEAPKFIPPEKMYRFCKLLREKAILEPKKVIPATIMIYGARTAESAAVKAHNIEDKGNYLNVEIFSQEKKGLRVPILKTEVSRRVMIIGDWGRIIILTALKHMSEEDIKDTSQTVYTSATELNSWIVELFKEAGIRSTSASDGEDLENDVSSYIMRRNFAGIARNWMGLSFAELNSQLGHKDGCDMKNVNRRIDVARKMSRYVFDPEIQQMSWDSPIDLMEFETYNLNTHSGYKFANNTLLPVTIEINLAALENDSVIEISGISNKQIEVIRASEQIRWEDRERNITGDSVSLINTIRKRGIK